MSKFIEQILKESKKYGIKLYNEAMEDESVKDLDTQNTTTSTDQSAPNQAQPEQPANAEEDPFPERFVYIAGLLQKALLDKFPSLMNIEKINQDNVGSVIQNMENLMKQAGKLDNINTKNINLYNVS